MGMPYVNAAMRAYYDVEMNNAGILSFVKPFDQAEVKVKDGKRVTPAFKVAIYLNILGSKDQNGGMSPITNGDTLVFRLNLTEMAKGREDRRSAVLDFFERKIEEEDCDEECFKFYNETRLVSVPPMVLPGAGEDFALKLFVMRKPEGAELENLRESSQYLIQSMKCLRFVNDIRAVEKQE